MSYHYSQGVTTTQAHKAIPEGCFEEEQGLKGFFGQVSHLIRGKPSTRWSEIEGSLKPRMYDLVKLSNSNGETLLLSNAQIAISWKQCVKQNLTYLCAERSADGDILFFVHKGEGIIFTEYGELNYKKGHYIVIPKCIAYVIQPMVESLLLKIDNFNSHYEEPDRGLLGRNALYDKNAIIKPDLIMQNKRIEKEGLSVKEIHVQHNKSRTVFKYLENIFDVIGWKGDLYPYALHVDDIMPLMSHRAHLPPSAHSTFVARDFIVCTFLPRPLETDDDALKVPFYHQNIDYDEVLFYHDGDFFSRDNLHPGMMSFHPAGFPHGPHPKAVKSIHQKTHTSEYAVMIDTRWPLTPSKNLETLELSEYWKSWQS